MAMTIDLTGKGALVTGGTSGIGASIVEWLAWAGARVAFVGRDRERGSGLASLLSERDLKVTFVPADLSTLEGCDEAFAAAAAVLEKVDILINGAGVIRMGDIVQTGDDDWRATMSVNLDATYRMCRAAVADMRSTGGGVIINVASNWGVIAAPKAAAYCASKAAVIGLTRALAIDHGPDNIRVIAVCPGDTDTPMFDAGLGPEDDPTAVRAAAAAAHPMRDIARPDDIARFVTFLVSDHARFVTGANILIDGGFSIG